MKVRSNPETIRPVPAAREASGQPPASVIEVDRGGNATIRADQPEAPPDARRAED